jgi:O-antigen/teichoic acid export membrane protein
MIARATTKPEYGIWFNIRDVLTYFTLLAGVLPFWALRFVARGKEGAVKTGVLANLTISVIAALIYVSLFPLIISALGISGEYFFLYFITTIQIIELHTINVFEQCLQAKKPHVIGYGLLLREISKVVLGYMLINRLSPLYGAMLSIIIAFILQVIYYFKLLSEDLKQRVRWDYLKEWVKGSVVNIYNVVGNQIASFIFIMLFAYGSDVARSDYGAAAQIAAIINYSSFLAFALYPKLLAERKREDVTVSMKIVLMFTLPMTAGAIVLSDSYLAIFGYKEAVPVLIVLAIDSLVATISGIYGTVLLGFERVDEEAKISFKELIRSRLSIVFSLPYLHSAITIPTTFYALTTYTTNDPVQAALYVGIINSAARFAMFFIQYVIVRKIVKIDIPWLSIAKYTIASSFMAAVLLVIPHPTTISLTLGITAIGGTIYLSALMAIDKEARILVKNIIQKIKIREFV